MNLNDATHKWNSDLNDVKSRAIIKDRQGADISLHGMHAWRAMIRQWWLKNGSFSFVEFQEGWKLKYKLEIGIVRTATNNDAWYSPLNISIFIINSVQLKLKNTQGYKHKTELFSMKMNPLSIRNIQNVLNIIKSTLLLNTMQ